MIKNIIISILFVLISTNSLFAQLQTIKSDFQKKIKITALGIDVDQNGHFSGDEIIFLDKENSFLTLNYKPYRGKNNPSSISTKVQLLKDGKETVSIGYSEYITFQIIKNNDGSKYYSIKKNSTDKVLMSVYEDKEDAIAYLLDIEIMGNPVKFDN